MWSMIIKSPGLTTTFINDQVIVDNHLNIFIFELL